MHNNEVKKFANTFSHNPYFTHATNQLRTSRHDCTDTNMTKLNFSYDMVCFNLRNLWSIVRSSICFHTIICRDVLFFDFSPEFKSLPYLQPSQWGYSIYTVATVSYISVTLKVLKCTLSASIPVTNTKYIDPQQLYTRLVCTTLWTWDAELQHDIQRCHTTTSLMVDTD